MEVTCERIATPPVFQRRSLVIVIDTQDELDLLETLFVHHSTVPGALVKAGALNNEEEAMLSGLFSQIKIALRRVAENAY